MNYAWILLVVIYAAFAIRFAVRQVRNIININDYRYADPGRWYYWPLMVLTFLIFVVLFAVWLCFRPRYYWLKRKERRRQEREEAERKAQEERIKKWEEEHPPVLYYNTDNGVTAVIPKADYEVAVRHRKCEIRNGLTTEKLLPLIFHTYLFLHTSAKKVPTGFQTGWLSDFDELREVAKVERRTDIFVPFVSEKTMPFSEQEKVLRKPTSRDLPARLEETRRFLLYVPVPDEVRFNR